ncbi:Signal transduction histidine-protein kinase BarA [Fundidesulfovibrio magnetotacticus]|uniref:Sensor protein FixL n=1 Tax=Fundidesulfovibrio magnetotacticus TaxID=2730080 RepID=A0A6V8LWS4_9BACT|nr:PAS domain S-box protein [Fundidesulfovibrio magnetotacticus]GFK94117.1 Signal transduction histidine-protein kinase BarA [Fundidesulfovibrio magnetotacticus]
MELPSRDAPPGQARLQALLDAAVDAIVIVGEDHLIQDFSQAASKLFGYDRREILGQPVDMLMPEPFRSAHAGYLRRYLDSGEPRIIGLGREVPALRKDGTTFPAYLSVGVGQEDGRRFFVGILHDLSREKEAFRRVRDLASLVDSTGDAVTGENNAGVVTYWNKGAAELFGYTAAEALGRDLAELLVPPERRAEFSTLRERLQKGEGPLRVETERLDKTGKRLIVSQTVSPIRDAEGRVAGASTIARDVTARRTAERAEALARRAAEEANRVKGDFLSIVSHELRTPLTVILGNIALLTDGGNMPGPEVAASIAQDIEDSANRLLGLINDLLDISDMEAGQAKLRVSPVQADELVREAVLAALDKADEKGLAITFEAAPLEITADPLRLKQALANLVDNAIKFTPSGSVFVGVSRAGNCALFEVTDTGPGIPDDQTARIFDAFHQADTSHTRAAQGAGLGLTIVRRIVELHGGVVNVQSEPGTGSSFFMAIPLTPPPGAVACTPAGLDDPRD